MNVITLGLKLNHVAKKKPIEHHKLSLSCVPQAFEVVFSGHDIADDKDLSIDID